MLAALVLACGGASDGVVSHVQPDNRVAEIRIQPSSASLAPGDSVDLIATAYNSSGGALGQQAYAWTSSSVAVASVTSAGRVTAIAVGTSTIAASSAGVTGRATITVSADTGVASVAITPATASVPVGGVVTLGAAAKNAAGQPVAGRTFTWTTSDPATATVNAAGEVTGVSAGAATITASTGGRSAVAVITVTALAGDSVVSSVAVLPASTVVETGTAATLIAIAKNSIGQTLGGRTFTWTSSNPAIAPVSGAGAVTGIAVGGPVTVTAAVAGASGTAEITVVPRGTSLGTITVNGAQPFQTMTGWEGLNGLGYGECDRRAFQTYAPIVIERLANEVGINRLRLPLRVGYEHPIDAFQQFEAGLITFDQWKLVMFVAQNDNNDPFVINPAGFNWGHLDFGMEHTVLPLKQRLQARGDDLWFNLSYTGANSAQLHRDNPEEYAELVLATFQHLQQKYGLVPNSLEIVNEPNVGGWSAQPVGYLAVAAKRRLNQAGFFPDFIAPSNSDVGSSIQYFDIIAAIPGVTQTLTDIAYHRYGYIPTVSQLQTMAQRGAQYGLRTAMLEGGREYKYLHEDLTLANVSAWQQFGLAFCNTTDNGGKYLGVAGAAIGQNSPQVITLKKTQYLRQYFRYVALRAVRVGATSSDARFAPVAFRNANGKYVVVVKADAAGSFTVGGLPAGSYGIDYTTASAYMQRLPDVTITGSQAIATAIPEVGVLTIFAK